MSKFKRILSYAISAAVIFGAIPSVSRAEENNLLYNGGFEGETAGAADWKFTSEKNWNNEGAANRTNTQYNSGEYSAFVTQGTIGQRVQLDAGTIYTLSAYVKADEKTVSPDMGFYADDSGGYPSGNPVMKLDIEAGSEWKKVTLQYECTKSGSYTICLMSWEDNVNVYFDDCMLAGEKQASIIINPDFSEGLNGWNAEGSGDIKAENGVLTASGTDYEARISQTVKGLDDGLYNLSAYASADSIGGICYLYGKSAGHTQASTAVTSAAAAQQILVPGIKAESGQIDIGLYIKGSSKVTLDDITLTKAEETRVPFLKGGEISKLTYVEDMGGVFKYADGTEGDALQIMAENGFNLARIRVLNDPGKGHGDGAYYLPKGYQTEEDCLRLAKRAKDKGMKILFSFAYSDYWVDGDKQIIPYEWQREITEQGLVGESKYKYLENKTYEYTKDIMEKLVEQGTCPEFVAIGNEIQVGLYFGDQKNRSCMWDSALYNSSAMLARFLNAGARAVREVSPQTKIVLHSDNGGNLSKRNTFINALGLIDFDVIGVSYYPFYNADVSIDTVVNEFNSLINKYDKDVIIMETGYNWSELRGDGYEGQLQNSGYYQNIYGETQEGQRAFLTELYSKLKQTLGGRCIGDLYWDPVMLYDNETYKIGWAIQEDGDYTQGNVVSNSTIFDFEGKAVMGQLAMKYNTNSDDDIKITGTVKDKNGVAADFLLTVTVNDANYTVTTDKFGHYIVAVPYPKTEKLNITANGGSQAYEKDTPSDGVFVYGVDFDLDDSEIIKTKDDVISIFNARKENGAIVYETEYEAKTEGALLYTALYDESGRLLSCKKDIPNGEFDARAEDGAEYTVKAFLWNKTEPLSDMKVTVK